MHILSKKFLMENMPLSCNTDVPQLFKYYNLIQVNYLFHLHERGGKIHH